MQDYQAEAERMWKSKATREEFTEIENLIAYLENQHRVKSYKWSQAKATDKPTAAVMDDTAMRARWNASKALQDEFDGDFEAYRAYELNKNRVKVWN